MGCLTRRFITEPERQQIFDRWFKGESQYSIARSLGRGHTSIQGVLSRTGGIRPMPVVGGARRDIAPEPLAIASASERCSQLGRLFEPSVESTMRSCGQRARNSLVTRTGLEPRSTYLETLTLNSSKIAERGLFRLANNRDSERLRKGLIAGVRKVRRVQN